MSPCEYSRPIKLRIDKTLGYQYFLDVQHPLAFKGTGRVYFHRHVASVTLGRWILAEEIVHHIDSIKTNNNPHNLEVISRSSHATKHAQELHGIKQPNKCRVCSKDTFNDFYCSERCSRIASRRVQRPSKEELHEKINKYPWVSLGRYYGVSDNAVRKWAKTYKLI